MMRWIRELKIAAAAALAAMSLCMCGRLGDGKDTIRFWNGFTGPDGRTMLRMVQAFNQEAPDTYVIQQRMDWAVYFNKLFVAGLGGRAPEVFVLHVDEIPRWLQAGFLRPIDDLISGPDGIDTKDFFSTTWDEVAYEGKHYALPLDVHPMALYYNKALFRQAGIVDEHGAAKPPRTQAEFLDAVARITQDLDGDGRPDQWGFVLTYLRTNFIALAAQWGGGMMADGDTTCTLDSPENVAAVQFCLDLIRRKLVPPPQDFGSWIGFRQGKVGMALEGVYMMADLERQSDLDWGVAPMPQLGPARLATWASSHVLCMRTGLDDTATKKAWHFMKYLSDHGLDWAAGGQVPIRLSQLNAPRFKAMTAQSVFARELDYIQYVPRVPYLFELLAAWDGGLESALRGSQTPEQALAESQAAAERAIARHHALMALAKEQQK